MQTEHPEQTLTPWFAVGTDRLRLLSDGQSIFAALLQAIESAEREILVEIYWFAADAAGARVRDALLAAARRGVTVRVVYDSFGSLYTNEKFWSELRRQPSARVRIFGPLAPWRRRFKFGRLLRRDHRKLVVIDSARAFIGGFNIGNEWWPPDGARGWRDDVLELIGPTALEIRSLFWLSWRKLGGGLPGRVPLIPREGNGLVWLIANDRRISRRREIRRTYLQHIRRARESIDIANAYFLPDHIVFRALRAARRRGVPVRILLPEKNDVPHFGLAQIALIPKLIRDGFEVYLYRPVTFHSKTAIIDDFVTIGSYNLDHRSWRYNLECNLAVFDRPFAEMVRKNFENDLKEARLITEAEIHKFPLLLQTAGWLLLKLSFML
ncbi:phosphatidylserine/phosphatidylglycerophosphate/cardiolipin synthase family protein [Patescibacteria group bacterium]|nr:MAG: phosphatidylserine/phosphatidylglycerophosphate/cardiolipin synthase family protein [Patescibacteria group bacterium]